MLNTAGGVTGGDRFALGFGAEPGAHLVVTTQAAERIYRATTTDAPGQISVCAQIADGARLDWLPQETILFEGARLSRHLRFDLDQGATLLACEMLVFGREAMGETLHDIALGDRIDLHRAGRLVFADRLRLAGDAQAQLDRAAIAGGLRAMASLILAAPGAAQHASAIRAALPAQSGVSALEPDLVFARALAPDSYILRQHIMPLLASLSPAPLPRTWML